MLTDNIFKEWAQEVDNFYMFTQARKKRCVKQLHIENYAQKKICLEKKQRDKLYLEQRYSKKLDQEQLYIEKKCLARFQQIHTLGNVTR